MRVPYYIVDLKRGPSLENYPPVVVRLSFFPRGGLEPREHEEAPKPHVLGFRGFGLRVLGVGVGRLWGLGVYGLGLRVTRF